MRELFARGAIALVASLLTLFFCDLLMRPLLRDTLYPRPTIMFLNRWPTNEILQRYDTNVRYTGTMCGDLAVMHGGPELCRKRAVYFETDELGFRNARSKSRDDNEAILLGDSFGAGSGGSQDEMLSYVLEEDYGIKNYNLSLGQASPWQELMTLREELPRIHLAENGAVVWLLFSGNDLDGRYGSGLELVRNSFLRRLQVTLSIFYNRSPVRQMLQRRPDLRDHLEVRSLDHLQMLFLKRYAQRAERDRADLLKHPRWKIFSQTFQEMTSFCAVRRLRLYVVLIPSKEETYWWVRSGVEPPKLALGQVLSEWAAESGVPFVDLSHLFARLSVEEYRRDRGLLFWPDDTHWNARGQRVAAQWIYRALRDESAASWTVEP